MSDTYSYEVLEPGGHARLVGNVLDRISEASANPASAVGSSRAMLGDAETASWMERTTAADGAALIESVKGNTLRWNQLYDKSTVRTTTTNGITFTVGADGSITAVGTATATAVMTQYGIPVVAGNKYLFKGCTSGGSDSTYYSYLTGAGFPYGGHIDTGAGVINVPSTTSTASYVLARIESGQTVDGLVFRPQLFDLTAMFGAGNEPSTVAEFEALYPEPYYPYDSGSLLPVRMEGVETVAADESWSSTLTIPASTYFPQGMRSAGSVRDELTSTEAITRVGVVDLGTLTWTANTDGTDGKYKSSRVVDIMHTGLTNASVPRAECAKYTPRVYFSDRVTDAYDIDKSIGLVYSEATSAGTQVFVYDSAYTTAAALKTALSGVMLHYELATPTTTPIDPPLPMSYRTGAGGIERVMVASGTTSAPPIFVTRYPLDPADLAASIAPVDGPIAKTNHQVGDLLMLGFTLCKATQVIVTGETIAIGTNVTKTTVAAELAALSQ